MNKKKKRRLNRKRHHKNTKESPKSSWTAGCNTYQAQKAELTAQEEVEEAMRDRELSSY